MKTIKEKKKETLKWRPSKQVEQGTPAGLARTHKIIRAERLKEHQFIRLCSQIRIEEFKQERAEQQRIDRRAKRK